MAAVHASRTESTTDTNHPDADQETGRMGRIRPPVGGDLRPYCQILLTLAYSPNTGMKV